MSIYAEYKHGVIDKAEFDYLANIENRKERDYEERMTGLPYDCEGCDEYEECKRRNDND